MYILLIAALIAIDQISKYIVSKYLFKIYTLPIIGDFLHFTYVENRGVAFGIFENKKILIVAISAIACIFGFYILNKLKKNKEVPKYVLAGTSLIIAGAMGNLIDRIARGYVVDFIDFRGIWSFVFNIADIFVICGSILVAIYCFIVESREDGREDGK